MRAIIRTPYPLAVATTAVFTENSRHDAAIQVGAVASVSGTRFRTRTFHILHDGDNPCFSATTVDYFRYLYCVATVYWPFASRCPVSANDSPGVVRVGHTAFSAST